MDRSNFELELESLTNSLSEDLSNSELTEEEAIKIYRAWGWEYVNTIVHFWYDNSEMTQLVALKREFAKALYDLGYLEKKVLHDDFSSYSSAINLSSENLLQIYFLEVFIEDFLSDKINTGELNTSYALKVLSIGTGYDLDTRQRLPGVCTVSWDYLKCITQYAPLLLLSFDKEEQVNLLYFINAFVTVTTNEDGVTERGCTLLKELESCFDLEVERDELITPMLRTPLALILLRIWENFFDWMGDEDLIPYVWDFEEELVGLDTKSHDEKYALFLRWCPELVTIFDFHVTFLGVKDFLEFVSSPDKYAKKVDRNFDYASDVIAFSDSLKILVEIRRDDWGKAELIANDMIENHETDALELSVPYLLGLIKKG